MNIRDAIAAGNTPNDAVITTTYEETQLYGRSSYLNGKKDGQLDGILLGMFAATICVVSGYVVAATTDLIIEKIKSRKTEN